MGIRFVKATAGGNDFIIIKKNIQDTSWIKNICNRKLGIGADGVLLLKKNKSLFEVKIFNSDGSSANMCANGAMCISKFATFNKLTSSNKFNFKMGTFLIDAEVYDIDKYKATVKISLPYPKNYKKINLKNKELHFVEVGVPHVVIINKKIDNINICEEARPIRYNEIFAPEGVNVNFLEIEDDEEKMIKVRTYERGVEDETYSCGTGAAACAAVLTYINKLQLPISINVKNRERLIKIYIYEDKIYEEGEVELVGEGIIYKKRPKSRARL